MRKWLIVFWIATWTGHYVTDGVCPEEIKMPPENPYTGEIGFGGPVAVNAVLLHCQRSVPREKIFDVKGDAEKFLSDCPQATCTDMKVEEVQL